VQRELEHTAHAHALSFGPSVVSANSAQSPLRAAAHYQSTLNHRQCTAPASDHPIASGCSSGYWNTILHLSLAARSDSIPSRGASASFGCGSSARRIPTNSTANFRFRRRHSVVERGDATRSHCSIAVTPCCAPWQTYGAAASLISSGRNHPQPDAQPPARERERHGNICQHQPSRLLYTQHQSLTQMHAKPYTGPSMGLLWLREVLPRSTIWIGARRWTWILHDSSDRKAKRLTN
jgi:hypothetical protein